MSRNPYLAASRPSSSYTRSSRTSSRTGATIGGSLLGRSRSSASLGGFGGHSTSSYGSTLSTSSYVPQWQRSSSSTRLNTSSLANSTSPSRSTTAPTETAATTTTTSSTAIDDAQVSRDNDKWQSTRSLDNNRTSLYKSTSSHSLANKRNERDNDQEASSNVNVLLIQ